ncbi:MAG: ribosomal L7Ae/L30e/S12e/Gadd45 family protein [Clostridiales bacterium]|nr:ribosomal L7Ae/L30e/S12e/Gadd45 family protein [Clostridiales bacterium]
MESQPYLHFKQTITESYDFSYSELDSITLNLMVVDGTVNVGELVFCLAGVVIILVGIIIMIVAASGVTVNKFKKELESRGPGYIDYVEQDFVNAVKFTKTVRIGREFTFLIKGTKCVMIPNNEIVWAYPVKTTHRTNGIKTGSTHSVKLLNNRKKAFILPADNADQANDIIDLYTNMTDTIVLGYDDGLNGLFARNFDEFLNIAYKNHIYGDKSNQYANDNYNDFDNGNYANDNYNNFDNGNYANDNYNNVNNGNNNYDNTNNTTM